MVQGQFCFIKEDYFQKYDKDCKLMQNKVRTEDGKGRRPYFVVFNDRFENAILWCVPISSQIVKYNGIMEHKLSRLRERGVTHPICNDIAFGYVQDRSSAFIISQMVPITEKYISEWWINDDGKPVTVSEPTQRFIKGSAKHLISRHNRGILSFFSDITELRKGLLKELSAERGTEMPTLARGTVLNGQVFAPYKKAEGQENTAQGSRVSPTKPKRADSRCTMEEYAASIVAARNKAVEERKSAEAKEKPKKSFGGREK